MRQLPEVQQHMQAGFALLVPAVLSALEASPLLLRTTRSNKRLLLFDRFH
jgi:hypothetical protein